jgi:hypothetical protein
VIQRAIAGLSAGGSTNAFVGTILPGTPADLGRFMAEETEKWGKVVKFAGIKPE